MRTPVLITTGFPDAEEAALRLGVPAARTRELIRRADEIADRTLSRKAKPKATGKNAKNGKAARKPGGNTSFHK